MTAQKTSMTASAKTGFTSGAGNAVNATTIARITPRNVLAASASRASTTANVTPGSSDTGTSSVRLAGSPARRTVCLNPDAFAPDALETADASLGTDITVASARNVTTSVDRIVCHLRIDASLAQVRLAIVKAESCLFDKNRRVALGCFSVVCFS